MINCCVCRKETDKYKCPKCQERYCSLHCYKEHRKVNCEVKSIATTTSLNAEQTGDLEPTVHQPFSTDDTVHVEKLRELRNSKDLLKLLQNPHLRALLQQIDVAPNAWKAMNAAMQEPLFLEFADECLKIVEPSIEEEQEELRKI